MKKILILGITGLLGNTLFRQLGSRPDIDLVGVLRNPGKSAYFTPEELARAVVVDDLFDTDTLLQLLRQHRPDVVLNCVGIIKHRTQSSDPLVSLPINALFPHRLARLCDLAGVRLVHVSTDCVFSGRKGMYGESDLCDAEELYGRSKALGEVTDIQNTLTIRTSYIGHALDDKSQLVDWFLSQEGRTLGFTKAIYSGLPAVELAKVIVEHILPAPALHGLYNLSSEPISKYDLLCMIARQYGKTIDIVADDRAAPDRSLDSSRFRQATGYNPPSWSAMVEAMHADFLKQRRP